MFVHPDLAPDVMMPVLVGRDLEDAALVAHRVVVADGALLLDAEDVGQTSPRPRHERAAGFCRRLAEAAIVLGDEDLGEEAVGRIQAGDAFHP